MTNKKYTALVLGVMLTLASNSYVYASNESGATTGKNETKLDTYAIDDVVVTASGYEQSAKEAPATVTVITQEDMNRKGFTDLRDVLADVEGVDIYGSPSRMGVANPSIRGMGSSYTLLMIDGVPLNTTSDSDVGPNGFGAQMSSFLPPKADIERIEIVKGPMSTLYGSEAVGGVINIITKKMTNEYHGSIGIDHTFETQSGRGDSTVFSASVTAPVIKDKLGIKLRGNFTRRLNSSDDGKTYDGANITPAGCKNYNIGTRIQWIPTKNSSYYLDLSNARVDYTDCGASNPGFRFDRQKYIFGAENKDKMGTWTSYISYQKTDLHNWGSLSNNQDKYRTMEGTNLIFNTKYVTQISSNHKLTAGLEVKREAVDLDTLRNQGIKGDLSTTNKSIFADDTWKLSNKLNFTYGLRYDMPGNFDSKLSPRGYLVYNADKKFTIKGGISSGYKSPSLVNTQNGIVAISDSSWGRGGGRVTYIHGNPNLKPETDINKEIGIYYGSENKNEFSAHLTYFDIDYRDKISTVEIDAHNTQYTNTTKANSHGIEFGTKFPICKNVDMKLNYTLTLSEIKGGTYDGRPIDHTPKHSFNARVNWYPTEDTTLWVDMQYRNGMARYTNSTANAAVVNAMGEYYRPFTIFNLGANHKINKNLTVNFAIKNLLDKDFDKTAVVNGTEYNYYCTPGKGGTGSYIGRRSFWLGLTYEF